MSHLPEELREALQAGINPEWDGCVSVGTGTVGRYYGNGEGEGEARELPWSEAMPNPLPQANQIGDDGREGRRDKYGVELNGIKDGMSINNQEIINKLDRV